MAEARWSPKQKQMAKDAGVSLVFIQIEGRTKKPAGNGISYSALCPVEREEELYALITRWCQESNAKREAAFSPAPATGGPAE
jgi:hypothetical protein